MSSSPTRRRARSTLAPDALTLDDVHSFYGESHVLQGVSFSLKPGQLLALLGRNGAGKTTCIATIVGFLPPRRGDIRLFGQSIARLKPETICRRGVAFVPQGRRVFPSLSVRENLDVARRASPDMVSPWTFDRVYKLFPRLRERHFRQVNMRTCLFGRGGNHDMRVNIDRRGRWSSGAAERFVLARRG